MYFHGNNVDSFRFLKDFPAGQLINKSGIVTQADSLVLTSEQQKSGTDWRWMRDLNVLTIRSGLKDTAEWMLANFVRFISDWSWKALQKVLQQKGSRQHPSLWSTITFYVFYLPTYSFPLIRVNTLGNKWQGLFALSHITCTFKGLPSFSWQLHFHKSL